MKIVGATVATLGTAAIATITIIENLKHGKFIRKVLDGITIEGQKVAQNAKESVTAITGKAAGSANKEDSPNAFAFKVNAAVSHTYSDGGTGGNIAGVMEGDHIKFTMDNGIATLGYTLEKQAMTDTFNTRDTSGTYTATLILTDKGAL